MQTSQDKLGLIFEDDQILVRFGQRGVTPDTYKQTYPQYDFLRIRQTHSDICIAASPMAHATEADAHFTALPGSALLIATADCIPLMIHCQQTQRIAAVHAGWRGVENQITVKTLQQLIASGSSENKFSFYFGPHIGSASFDVDEDVCVRLKKSSCNLRDDDYIARRNGKYFIDLQQIVISQIQHICGEKSNIFPSRVDTKTHPDFHSYRRDGQTGERNWSWIVLKIFSDQR
jgi:YfiH family protein